MKQNVVKMSLFCIILLGVVLAYQPLLGENYRNITPVRGVADVTAVDLNREIAFIRGIDWEYYAKEYYTPTDFAEGAVPVETLLPSNAPAPYGTHRVRLMLPAGQTYGIAGMSLLFSQRLYVNGQLLGSIGWPEAEVSTTIPQTKRYVYAFTPTEDITEVIFHVASFHLPDGGGKYPFLVSEISHLLQHEQTRSTAVSLVAGCLIMAGLFYLGLFIFFPSRYSFLYFALLCVLIALRTLVTGDKLLQELCPWMTWVTAYRVEYVNMVLMFMCFTLYIGSLFSGTLHKWARHLVLGVGFGYVLLIMGTQPRVFTSVSLVFHITWIITIAWLMVQVALWFKKQITLRLESLLLGAGLATLVLGAGDDFVRYAFPQGIDSNNMLQKTMIACICVHMVALALEFLMVESELSEAAIREHELRESNLLQERLALLRTEFMANISHELKTPLTVISLNAQLAKTLVRSNAIGEEVEQSLDIISNESRRLGRMVGEILELSQVQEQHSGFSAVDIRLLLEKTTEIYRSLLRRHENTLFVGIAPDLAQVYGNADMLVQVIVNLIANANAHTQGGSISVDARTEGEIVVVEISDTGTGIAPEHLPHLFEWRYSANSGSAGLGLYICKMIMERHEGEIAVTSSVGHGTTVRLELKAYYDVDEEPGQAQ